jgi:hypothetical protein
MNYLTLSSIPDESTAAAWNDCLNNSDFAGLYTAPEYLGVEYFQGGAFAVLAVSDSLVHGVVTGFRSDREITCGVRASPRICIRRGANAEMVGRVLAAGLKNHCLRSTKFIAAFAWHDVAGLQSAGFRPRTYESPLGTILLDPSKGADALLRECSPARRYNIRRAIKNGVEVEDMNLALDFDDYCSLYSHWCEVKRQRRQPYEIQRAVFELGGNRLRLVARHNGRVIGVSTFRYRRPGIMEYTANVSRPG